MGARRKKLVAVARLYYSDRAKFGRTCQQCRSVVYDEDTGEPRADPSRRDPVTLKPLPMVRSARMEPPCHTCAKTAHLSDRERHWRNLGSEGDPPAWCYRAFRHWRRLAAVGFAAPETADPLVRRNALIFAGVRDSAERGRNEGLLVALGLLKRA